MRIVRNREGFLVDADTGVVIEEPIDYEHPEYRIFSHEDYLRKSHYSPLDEVRRTDHERPYGVGEEVALRELGIKGLAIQRCLVNAGFNSNLVIGAIKRLSISARGYGKVFKYALTLRNALDKAVRESLIRWNSRALGVIDLRYVSERFRAPIVRGRVPQVVIDVDGLKVQITKSKIDIASRLYDRDRVADAVLKLRKLLGVELSEPRPKVATVVIDLPFELNLSLVTRLGGIYQGHRVKVLGDFWSALIFSKTVNIYVNLKNDLSRIELALLQCLPKVCFAAKI